MGNKQGTESWYKKKIVCLEKFNTILDPNNFPYQIDELVYSIVPEFKQYKENVEIFRKAFKKLKTELSTENKSDQVFIVKKLKKYGKNLLKEKYDLKCFIDLYYKREKRYLIKDEIDKLVLKLESSSDPTEIIKLKTIIDLKKDKIYKYDSPNFRNSDDYRGYF